MSGTPPESRPGVVARNTQALTAVLPSASDVAATTISSPPCPRRLIQVGPSFSRKAA